MGENKGCVILYELNEVPWRVIDWYIRQKPKSAFQKILKNSESYTSFTKDEGELHPWSTWPTVHRGVYNSAHRILFLNQDKSCAKDYLPIWEILAKKNKKVGVFGSLQSYPIPSDLRFSFYIPDTFSPAADTYPKAYSTFQRFNLRQTKLDGAIASDIKIGSHVLIDLVLLKFIGMRFSTYGSILKQIFNEKRKKIYRVRRPLLQAPVAFDVFRHALIKNPVQFCTFFTNHVAGVMHRYWKYAFPEDFNYELKNAVDFFHRDSLLLAMDIADKQINFLKEYVDKHDGTLIVASSMGQEAIERGKYNGELRIDDINVFMKAIGFNKPFIYHLAMQPDFNFEFSSVNDANEFYDRIQRLKDSKNKTLSCRLRTEGNTVNFGLGNPLDILQKEVVFCKNGDDVAIPLTLPQLGIKKIFRDVGTGYHQPKGTFILYEKNLVPSGNRKEIESTQILPMILEKFEH